MAADSLFQNKQEDESRSRALIPILLVSALLFAGVVVLILFVLQPGTEQRDELVGILREDEPNYEWYRKYVELKKPQVKMAQNFRGNRMVVFAGVIENGGEKTLDVVEIELQFFNYDKLVWKVHRTPIRPGPYTPAIEPLEERGFTLYIDDISEDWLASHAEMSISGFRFASQP